MAAVSHLPVAASSGSFLITPDVGLMIWTLLLFGISMYILWKLAFPRISEALERRQHAIEESIDHAERVRHDADELLEEYRERLREARGQAEQIIDRARKSAEARERETLEETQQRREQLMEQTRRDIEVETRRAIQQIRREVADLLGEFTKALNESRDLMVFFFSPYFSTEEKKDGLKRAVIDAEPVLMNFFEALIERHRMPAIFRIKARYEILWEDERDLLPVEVTSAVELD